MVRSLFLCQDLQNFTYFNVCRSIKMAHNVSGLCVVALSINLKLTTTLDRAITQNPCYVPLNYQDEIRF